MPPALFPPADDFSDETEPLSGRAAAWAREDRETLAQMLEELRVPGPCDDCPHRARCATGEACEQYRGFVHGRSRSRWSAASRQPSAAIYAAVFGEGVTRAA
jgi:hypothetical protein